MKSNVGDSERNSEGSLLNEWIRLSTNSWSSVAQMWAGLTNGPESPSGLSEKSNEGPKESWQAAFKMFQTMWSAPMNTEACRFEDMHRDMLGKWMEYYEKEVRPVLNAPQLGLTRSYQEKLNQAIDRSNIFQAAMAELLWLLYVPVQESLRAVQEGFEQQATEGNPSEDLKDDYQKWIKVLESHYMNLFRSPSYLQSLHQVLTSAEDFKTARDGMLADALKVLPIPTNRDMDELCKEVYHLKKKVQELAQREVPECYLLHDEGGHA